MRLKRSGLSGLGVVLVVAASCGGAKYPTTQATTTTAVIPPITAHVTVSPDQGVAGTNFAFAVAIRGPGTVNAEAVQFGDGGTSGANAGTVSCGETARADRNSRYGHTYTRPGTYRFSDDVYVIGPPPACTNGHVRAALTLVVAAPMSSATLNGAFLSPTRNIACYINVTGTNSVRCATFSPPQLVTMNSTGAFQACYGRTCELGNPAQETPVLAYGSATGAAPFQCLSSETGMTCTVVGHKGFVISRSGIEPVG